MSKTSRFDSYAMLEPINQLTKLKALLQAASARLNDDARQNVNGASVLEQLRLAADSSSKESRPSRFISGASQTAFDKNVKQR